MRLRSVVGVLVVLAVIAGVGAFVVLRRVSPDLPGILLGRPCTVGSGDGSVSLDTAQMANAATIAAVGLRRGVPDRAVVIALATAFQESELRNLAHGDRDSLGLFQQRTSQGWGTEKQIQDPRYAAGKFYSALLKVKGWQQMRVTEAAQKVQRSAYPEAYQKWADEAEVLTAALAGHAEGAVTCRVTGQPGSRGPAAAEQLGAAMRKDWGKLLTVAGGADTGIELAATSDRSGWQLAHWLVAHAADRGVSVVRFGTREWRADSGGWKRVDASGGGAGERVVAEVFAPA
ncbi:heavy metal transporter [Luedemannella flava]|uniref:Heavy metal transporter n=1 Tax=Luedemannella flava TaxID=349316 RepID=A0ABP4XZS4_9ACTN